MDKLNRASPENDLLTSMQLWAESFGFQKLGVADINLDYAEKKLVEWLHKGFHGEMSFMEKHGSKRTRPQQLVDNTIRVITVRMDYFHDVEEDAWSVIANKELGYISRYALGRDYHKLMRKRLAKLAEKIQQEIGQMGYRVFCDSAPVMEKALAEKSGIGWVGKNSMILSKDAGSYFFLGEIYTDLPLALTEPVKPHCGRCTACMDVCPTQAIVAPYQVDARRCISYLTIELRGSIPEEFRPLMGNRIYGCDDCQLICPWNRFATNTVESDYLPRNGLAAPELLPLFAWTESEFLTRLEGSPIRRIGYQCWLRNIAVALGNADYSDAIVSALQHRRDAVGEMVKEHIDWALKQQLQKYQTLSERL